jgi:FkbM family methyltransferase
LLFVRRGYRLQDKLILFICSFLRSIPFQLAIKIVNLLIRKVEVSYRNMRINLVDWTSAVMLHSDYESFLKGYINLKRGHVFIDVGAHMGLYTLWAAKIVGEDGLVVAIEPHPINCCMLLHNVQINGLKNVIVVNAAAWSDTTECKMWLAPESGGHSVTEHVSSTYIVVRARALDDILREFNIAHVDFIKIDVEGAEVHVLKGMTRTLQKNKPKLILESRLRNLNKVKSILSEAGYSVVEIPGSLDTTFKGVEAIYLYAEPARDA